MATTLKTLVLKTATATGVKPAAPADRIGLGLVAVATYPADGLSPSPGSEPNPGRRQPLSAAHRQPSMRAMATADAPAGPAGRSVPGSPAHRRPSSATLRLSSRWQQVATKRPADAGRVALATTPAAVRRRARVPAAASLRTRFGSDCQSPDRVDDRRFATTDTRPTAAAGK